VKNSDHKQIQSRAKETLRTLHELTDNIQTIVVGRAERKRKLGRPRHRWKRI